MSIAPTLAATAPKAITPGYLTHDSILARIVSPAAGLLPLITRTPELTNQNPSLSEYVGPWSCDLHMGPEAVLSHRTELIRLDWGDAISIGPGEFGVLLTEETISIHPDIAGFISLRFSHSKRGLINISGRHVDPHYTGRIVFTVYNAGPNVVPIRRGDPVFMIVFATLDAPVSARSAPIHHGIQTIPTDLLTSLHGPPKSLERVELEVAALEARLEGYAKGSEVAQLKAEIDFYARAVFPAVLGAFATVVGGIIVYLLTK